ncbi:U2 snRNP component IST3 [Phytophthora infestans T30-4]|uniref:U2 snRNP component IST3 n=1 Tax=Phytophthora infestans (strain T30-4) TaxID=403677 RepID=D0N4N0_PHYIT|nr:U2 snRNP component IST3 [Phytophthora infestans T30-4]EEY69838.1 U2 snRNP component IST3 [Phytophthora infestans T30-4]|eukprot:XP_002998485.1 U2 snRNP component IST3 [Phytophthora infestans T30-4]
MNVVAEIQRLNERELELNVPLSGSWHQKYSESAWVFVGGLPFELSEGDVLCVLSQFGEIEDIHLVRDGKTGKSKGFVFIKFEDQRSTILAVDNLNGFKLLERVLRVDHVLKYKLPKELQEDSDSEDEEEKKQRGLPGHAYEGKELASDFDLHKGVDNIFEQVQKRRQEQRLKEEREAVQREEESEAPQPSATGWRGRLEPSAPQPRRDNDRKRQGEEREKREDKSFGGMSRTR